jgi:tRNA-dihydrouridine synthase C
MPEASDRIMIAPMEGVVDPWIREIISSYGDIDFCVTEFIRVTSQIVPDHVFYDYAPELKTESKTKSGTPVFLQLLGSDLNFMAENAFKAANLGAYGIDINFGCPAKTVNRHDGGSVILKNPERVYQITNAVRNAVPAHIQVNAKVRLGFEHKDFHKEIAQAAEAGGAGWLAVHARTKVDGYKPPAYWTFIKSMKDSVKNMPIIANGEIWNLSDYNRCRKESDCDDVMIGRGLMAEPLLAKLIRKQEHFTFEGQTYNLKSEADLIYFYLKHFVLKYIEICPRKDTNFLVGRSKQLIKLLGRNHKELNLFFEKIKPCQNFKDIESLIHEYLRNMSERNQ